MRILSLVWYGLLEPVDLWLGGSRSIRHYIWARISFFLASYSASLMSC